MNPASPKSIAQLLLESGRRGILEYQVEGGIPNGTFFPANTIQDVIVSIDDLVASPSFSFKNFDHQRMEWYFTDGSDYYYLYPIGFIPAELEQLANYYQFLIQ
jgi:hypothetical protein